MVKYTLIIALLAMTLQSFAQTAAPDAIETLDGLDQQKLLLQKQLDVAKLQADLQATERKGGTASTVETTELKPINLRLIKITGLESAPEAVFLYNGYRLVANKGEMVLPTVQLRVVTASHVIIKDVSTGKESVLWLTTDQGNAAPSPNTGGASPG